MRRYDTSSYYTHVCVRQNADLTHGVTGREGGCRWGCWWGENFFKLASKYSASLLMYIYIYIYIATDVSSGERGTRVGGERCGRERFISSIALALRPELPESILG